MTKHPRCPYGPESNAFQSHYTERFAPTESKHETHESIDYNYGLNARLIHQAAQMILDRPEFCEFTLGVLEEQWQTHFSRKSNGSNRVLGHDNESAFIEAKRGAVWAAFWSLANVETMNEVLSCLDTGKDLLLPDNKLTHWQNELDERHTEEPYTIYYNNLFSMLDAANRTVLQRIDDPDDPYHRFRFILTPMQETLNANRGLYPDSPSYTTLEGLRATAKDNANSVTYFLKAYDKANDIHANPFTLVDFAHQSSLLPRLAAHKLTPVKGEVTSKVLDSLVDEEGRPHLPPKLQNLAKEQRWRCIGQYPLIAPDATGKATTERFRTIAQDLGATLPQDHPYGCSEFTTSVAIIGAMMHTEYTTG